MEDFVRAQLSLWSSELSSDASGASPGATSIVDIDIWTQLLTSADGVRSCVLDMLLPHLHEAESASKSRRVDADQCCKLLLARLEPHCDGERWNGEVASAERPQWWTHARYFETPLKAQRDGSFGLDLDVVDGVGFRVSANEGSTALSAGDHIIGVGDVTLYCRSEDDIEELDLPLGDGVCLCVLRPTRDVGSDLFVPDSDPVVGYPVVGTSPSSSSTRAPGASLPERSDGLLQQYLEAEAYADAISELTSGIQSNMEVGTRDPPSSTFEIQPRAQRGRRKRRSDPKQVESANAESRGLAEARGVPTEEQLARMETIFSGTVPQYEYKNHTADIIFHAWGNSLKAAFEQVAVCMFSYMTDLNRVEASEYVELSAEGHSLENLLYHFLDELLFHFLTTMHVCKYVEVIVPLLEGRIQSTLEPDIRADPTAAISPWTVRMRCYGEPFQSEAEGGRHTQGTEIKAITMHEMRINDNRCKPQEGVDKPEDPFQPTEETSDESMASDFVDLYVLVDI